MENLSKYLKKTEEILLHYAKEFANGIKTSCIANIQPSAT